MEYVFCECARRTIHYFVVFRVQRHKRPANFYKKDSVDFKEPGVMVEIKILLNVNGNTI